MLEAFRGEPGKRRGLRKLAEPIADKIEHRVLRVVVVGIQTPHVVVRPAQGEHLVGGHHADGPGPALGRRPVPIVLERTERGSAARRRGQQGQKGFHQRPGLTPVFDTHQHGMLRGGGVCQCRQKGRQPASPRSAPKNPQIGLLLGRGTQVRKRGQFRRVAAIVRPVQPRAARRQGIVVVAGQLVRGEDQSMGEEIPRLAARTEAQVARSRQGPKLPGDAGVAPDDGERLEDLRGKRVGERLLLRAPVALLLSRLDHCRADRIVHRLPVMDAHVGHSLSRGGVVTQTGRARLDLVPRGSRRLEPLTPLDHGEHQLFYGHDTSPLRWNREWDSPQKSDFRSRSGSSPRIAPLRLISSHTILSSRRSDWSFGARVSVVQRRGITPISANTQINGSSTRHGETKR